MLALNLGLAFDVVADERKGFQPLRIDGLTAPSADAKLVGIQTLKCLGDLRHHIPQVTTDGQDSLLLHHVAAIFRQVVPQAPQVLLLLRTQLAKLTIKPVQIRLHLALAGEERGPQRLPCRRIHILDRFPFLATRSIPDHHRSQSSEATSRHVRPMVAQRLSESTGGEPGALVYSRPNGTRHP